MTSKDNKSTAYKLTHCIHCGQRNFENFEKVLEHIKTDCPKVKNDDL